MIYKVSIGGELTLASRRRLSQIAAEGEYVQKSTIELVINKERASLPLGW